MTQSPSILRGVENEPQLSFVLAHRTRELAIILSICFLSFGLECDLAGLNRSR